MAQFVTGEAARERFRELADQVDAAYAEMRALSSDAVGNEFRVELAERLETQDRTNRGLIIGYSASSPTHPTRLATCQCWPTICGRGCASHPRRSNAA
ncbi:MAG: hypothetical protein QOD36_2766 [Mycobacterium sp.]|nr:hypothetical protein [Mycobacterium sp.]